MFFLFSSDRCLSFSHSTLQSFTGHVAVILLDEHDFRLKRSNVSNRAVNNSAAMQPFDTVVCAWSDQISSAEVIVSVAARPEGGALLAS